MISRAFLKKFADLVETPLLPLPTPTRNLILSKRAECIDTVREAFADQISKSVMMSIPKRQYEYVIGRLATAVLLVENGIPNADVWIQSQQRRPVWPSGIIGSISHSSELIAVSVCPTGFGINSIGVDIELLNQDSEAMIAIANCFTSKERRLLENVENGFIIGFSTKEALFKCLNPINDIFFDFLEAEITHINCANQIITLVLLSNLGAGLPAGTYIIGNYRIFNNHVWTGVYRHQAEK